MILKTIVQTKNRGTTKVLVNCERCKKEREITLAGAENNLSKKWYDPATGAKTDSNRTYCQKCVNAIFQKDPLHRNKMSKSCNDKYASDPELKTRIMDAMMRNGTHPSLASMKAKNGQATSGKSEEDKAKVRSKKQKTWASKPLEEQIAITQKKLNHKTTTKTSKGTVVVQASYERVFIDCCLQSKEVKGISDGPTILFDGKRLYLSDFMVTLNDGTKVVVEIKSNWTYSKHKNLVERKSAAAKSMHDYKLFILDNEENWQELLTWLKLDYIPFAKLLRLMPSTGYLKENLSVTFKSLRQHTT